jgi:hypothetical protein
VVADIFLTSAAFGARSPEGQAIDCDGWSAPAGHEALAVEQPARDQHDGHVEQQHEHAEHPVVLGARLQRAAELAGGQPDQRIEAGLGVGAGDGQGPTVPAAGERVPAKLVQRAYYTANVGMNNRLN